MFVSYAVSMTYRPVGSTIQALVSSAFAYTALAALLATITSLRSAKLLAIRSSHKR